MSWVCRALSSLLLAGFAGLAAAQGYPSKPVRIVAPFPPGGPIDTLARVVGEQFQKRTGQPMVVENRPGGAGNIGIQAVAQSAPDGYTWLFIPQGNITINATLMKDLPFSWERDFEPVTLVAYAPNLLVVHPSVPAASVSQLILLSRKTTLTYGSPGIGSSLHLIGELMNREAGIKLVHVPYKGTTQAMQDLLGGQISMMFGSLPTLMPQVRAGKLRALAVTTAKRTPAAPDLPTLVEAGLKNLDVPSWYGVLVAAKTPKAIVEKIQAEISAIVHVPETLKALEAQGMYPVANRPDEFATQIKGETATWARIIKESGIRPE